MDTEKKAACHPIATLLRDTRVLGVARFEIQPAFTGRTFCTLAYTADKVHIEVIDARTRGRPDFRGVVTKPLAYMRHFAPLANWPTLRATAAAAPSCCSRVLDGVGYHHAVLDPAGGYEAGWLNPDWHVHRPQWELASAYRCLIDSSGILLEVGTRVEVRSGPFTGFIGTVENLERDKDRVRVGITLGGRSVVLDLTVGDIRFPEDSPS